jgi:hypothetical protein
MSNIAAIAYIQPTYSPQAIEYANYSMRLSTLSVPTSWLSTTIDHPSRMLQQERLRLELYSEIGIYSLAGCVEFLFLLCVPWLMSLLSFFPSHLTRASLWPCRHLPAILGPTSLATWPLTVIAHSTSNSTAHKHSL